MRLVPGKAKCPIFKAIVAGFMGNVVKKNRTRGVLGIVKKDPAHGKHFNTFDVRIISVLLLVGHLGGVGGVLAILARKQPAKLLIAKVREKSR